MLHIVEYRLAVHKRQMVITLSQPVVNLAGRQIRVFAQTALDKILVGIQLVKKIPLIDLAGLELFQRHRAVLAHRIAMKTKFATYLCML